MLNTSGQVKVLLPDGTTKTYELNWDNSVKSWKDENNSALDTTEEAAEALKTFLGTDDAAASARLPRCRCCGRQPGCLQH